MRPHLALFVFPELHCCNTMELKIQADLSIVHQCDCGWIFLNVDFNRIIGIDDVIIRAGPQGIHQYRIKASGGGLFCARRRFALDIP